MPDRPGELIGTTRLLGPAFRLRESHFKEIGRRCAQAAADITRRIEG